jgi:hypothetical protein
MLSFPKCINPIPKQKATRRSQRQAFVLLRSRHNIFVSKVDGELKSYVYDFIRIRFNFIGTTRVIRLRAVPRDINFIQVLCCFRLKRCTPE